MIKQGIHVQIRHASQADTMGRPRVYLKVTPGYPIAVSGEPFNTGYLGRGETFVFSW